MPLKGPSEQPISGDEIVGELIRNMKAGKFKIGSTVFVPSIYNVYLHAEAYALLEGIRDEVIELARKALDDKLARLNRPTILRYIIRPLQYKTPNTWVVQFEPDHAGTLGPDGIMVSSVFGGTEPAKYGSGAVTVRITRGGAKAGSSSHGSAAGSAPGSGSPPPASTPPIPSPGTVPAAGPWATICYRDGGPPQVFSPVPEEVRIGRGGATPEVHLFLKPTEISSLHLVLRRDRATGKAFVMDYSMNGTWLDGVRLTKDVEVPLPAKCEITLAQKAVIMNLEIP